MHDLVVREALKTMSRDAAKRFRELVASGEQIPYDVEESGGGSALPQYIPLTERFIGDHAPALLEVDSFGAGCAAIESAGLAAPYLEELAFAVPPDPRKRGELAGIAFLCRLWEGSTDFSVDDERLTSAIEELEAGGDVADDEIEVVVPLRGLQLPVTRLELATATIVRADTVEVPPEARSTEGTGVAGWEPVFLAATRVGTRDADVEGDDEAQPDVGARAVSAFRLLVTTLRLFKAGSVSLGPYAWTRAGTNRWRRIATGAGRSRPGGYRLAEQELGDLAALSRTLAYRSSPLAPSAAGGAGRSRVLARAISRFEAGLERSVVLEALNDYLLALRFLLEGGGPAQLSLSMRVSGLCAEPEHRDEIKAVVDRGLTLERELWGGGLAVAGDDDGPGPGEVTATIEDLGRAILRDAACGHLGSDLRSTADEILLADGLAVGEGRAEQRGGPEEWDSSVEPDAYEPEPELHEPVESGAGDPGPEADIPDELYEEPYDEPVMEPEAGSEEWIDAPAEWVEPPRASEPTFVRKVPEPGGRIKMEPAPDPEEQTVLNAQAEPEPPTTTMEALPPRTERLAERLDDAPRADHQTADRVAYLFPRPETTEWDVREISYDRRRRARVRAS
jgi:hypothetical protein